MNLGDFRFDFGLGGTLFPPGLSPLPKTVMMNNNVKQLKSRPGVCTSNNPPSRQLFFRSIKRWKWEWSCVLMSRTSIELDYFKGIVQHVIIYFITVGRYSLSEGTTVFWIFHKWPITPMKAEIDETTPQTSVAFSALVIIILIACFQIFLVF